MLQHVEHRRRREGAVGERKPSPPIGANNGQSRRPRLGQHLVVGVDAHRLEPGRGDERTEELAGVASHVEVPPDTTGEATPGEVVAPGRVAVERTDGGVGGGQRIQLFAQGLRVDDVRHRPIGHRGRQLDVTGDGPGQVTDVPHGEDTAASLLLAQVGHLVVVAHLAAGCFSSHRDRHPSPTLQPPDRVARMGDHDIGLHHSPAQLVRRHPRLVVTARRRHRRRAGLDEHVVLGAQQRCGTHQSVERPSPHPDGDHHRCHQLSSPTSTERGRSLNRCGRCTSVRFASAAHMRAARPGLPTMLNVSTHQDRTPRRRAARKYGTATAVPAETIRSTGRRDEIAIRRCDRSGQLHRVRDRGVDPPVDGLCGEQFLRVGSPHRNPSAIEPLPPGLHGHQIVEHTAAGGHEQESPARFEGIARSDHLAQFRHESSGDRPSERRLPSPPHLLPHRPPRSAGCSVRWPRPRPSRTNSGRRSRTCSRNCWTCEEVALWF